MTVGSFAFAQRPLLPPPPLISYLVARLRVLWAVCCLDDSGLARLVLHSACWCEGDLYSCVLYACLRMTVCDKGHCSLSAWIRTWLLLKPRRLPLDLDHFSGCVRRALAPRQLCHCSLRLRRLRVRPWRRQCSIILPSQLMMRVGLCERASRRDVVMLERGRRRRLRTVLFFSCVAEWSPHCLRVTAAAHLQHVCRNPSPVVAHRWRLPPPHRVVPAAPPLPPHDGLAD